MRAYGWIVILLACAAALPLASGAEEEFDWKTSEVHPLIWKYDLADAEGHRLTLSRWTVNNKHYFLLQDGETRAPLEKLTAETMVTIPTVYKDVEYKVSIRPEPGATETRTRRVVAQAAHLAYRSGGADVLSISSGKTREVSIGKRQYTVIPAAVVPVEKLQDLAPTALFSLDKVAKQTPWNEYTVTDARGESCTLHIWHIDASWYFVLANGQTVMKKSVLETQELIPGVDETRVRRICVAPATVDADGKPVQAVYKNEEFKVNVKPQTFSFHGQQESIVITPGRSLSIGGQNYSFGRQPATDGRQPVIDAPKPVKTPAPPTVDEF